MASSRESCIGPPRDGGRVEVLYLYQHIIEFIDREIDRLQKARSILTGPVSRSDGPLIATEEGLFRFQDTETNSPIAPNGGSIEIEWPPVVTLEEKGRKRWSAEARKAHSERLRARWRKRKADAELERRTFGATSAAKKSPKKK